MPKVTLEFEVKQTGVDVRQVVAETTRNLSGLQTAAAGASASHDRLAASTDRAGVSYRTLNTGVRDLAMAFGSTSPEITNIVLGLGHVAERMSGATTSAKLLGAGVLAVGGTIALLVSQASRT